MRFALLLLFLACLPHPSLAQFDEDFISSIVPQNEAYLEMNPNFPDPLSKYEVSINDYSLPVTVIKYEWYIDGQLVTEHTNRRSINLVSKDVNERTDVEVLIYLVGGQQVRVGRVVMPYYLDIIIEPQTRTPAFYRGRPLPSPFSQVNASALVHDGLNVMVGLSYIWSLNNKVLENGLIRGRSGTTFRLGFGQSAILSVGAYLSNGEQISERLVEIPILEPQLAFYEISTMFGFKQRVLEGPTQIIGSSLKVRAEPYFLDLDSYNQVDFLEWKVDGKLIEHNPNNPYEILLSPIPGAAGNARVDFHVRNLSQLLQGVSGSLTVVN